MARQYGHNTSSSDQARAVVANELQQRASVTRKVEWGIAGALLVIGVISLGSGIVTSASGKAEIAEVRDEIANQQVVLEEAKEKVENYKPTTQATTSSAAQKGIAICNLQNKLSEFIAQENKAHATTLSAEHVTALQQLEAELTPDHGAPLTNRALFRSWCPYGKWSFDGTYSYYGDRRSFVWSCYMEDDTYKTKPLMFAIGEYDSKTANNFTKINFIYTKYYYCAEALYGLVNLEIPEEEREETVVTEPVVTEELPDVTTIPIVDLPDDEETTETRAEEITRDPDEDRPVTEGTTAPVTEPPVTETEPVTTTKPLEFYYSWSSAYGCWGYFDSEGRFYTLEEYEMLNGSPELLAAAHADETTTAATTVTDNASTSYRYVLNHRTNVFHRSSCSQVSYIDPDDRENSDADRDDLLHTYRPCTTCNP